MKKKIAFAVMMIVTLGITLVGCGSKNMEGDSTSTDSTNTSVSENSLSEVEVSVMKYGSENGIYAGETMYYDSFQGTIEDIYEWNRNYVLTTDGRLLVYMSDASEATVIAQNSDFEEIVLAEGDGSYLIVKHADGKYSFYQYILRDDDELRKLEGVSIENPIFVTNFWEQSDMIIVSAENNKLYMTSFTPEGKVNIEKTELPIVEYNEEGLKEEITDVVKIINSTILTSDGMVYGMHNWGELEREYQSDGTEIIQMRADNWGLKEVADIIPLNTIKGWAYSLKSDPEIFYTVSPHEVEIVEDELLTIPMPADVLLEEVKFIGFETGAILLVTKENKCFIGEIDESGIYTYELNNELTDFFQDGHVKRIFTRVGQLYIIADDNWLYTLY